MADIVLPLTTEKSSSGERMGSLKSKNEKNVTSIEKHKFEPMDDNDISQDFMCGVVEGFYGRPWTAEQRKELFARMKDMGLNTYLYAPKDDYKHRLFWREKYSNDEAAILKTLIDEAFIQNVTFVYAISPGLDMVFGSEKEIKALKEKLLQVKSLGCQAFALLFDDIDPILCAADAEEFDSCAEAQASITNLMFKALDQPKFIFCPTEYCSSMAIPNVENSLYLKTIGESLYPSISVMWTGPKVVSKIISVESIEILNKILKRKVMIWDNIHANDYDPKRIFLGPIKGRSTKLVPLLGGILTNPNCEFEANFIAMHSLATWWKSFTAEEKVEIEEDPKLSLPTNSEAPKTSPIKSRENYSSDTESVSSSRASNSDADSDYSSNNEGFFSGLINFHHGDYDPNAALEIAIKDWLPIFSMALYPTRKVIPRSGNPPALPQLPPITSLPPTLNLGVTSTITDPVLSLGVKENNSFVGMNKSTTLLTQDNESKYNAAADNSESDKPNKIELDVEMSPKLTESDIKSEDFLKNANNLSEINRKDENNGEKKTIMDIEMKEVTIDKIEDKNIEDMQIEPCVKSPSSVNDLMETEEVTELDSMQTDDIDSDVSMATQQSGQPGDIEITMLPSPGPNNENLKKEDAGNDETLAVEVCDVKGSEKVETEAKSPKKAEPISADDLQLVVECFYLPYEHGTMGSALVNNFKWLKESAKKLCRIRDKKSDEYLDNALDWSERALTFEKDCRHLQAVFNKLCSCPNRALLYDIFPYLWDMKGVVTMLRSYIKWLGRIEVGSDTIPACHKQDDSPTSLHTGPLIPGLGWLGPDPEPWVFRGGLSGEFQRLLPICGAFDLFCQPLPLDPEVSTFVIRPYVPADEKSVFDVCFSTHDGGIKISDAFSSYKELPADQFIGALLTFSPEYCFIVEDESGICGYLCATLNAKSFWRNYEMAYLPDMREKYSIPEEVKEEKYNEVEKMIVEFHSTEDRFSYGSDNLNNTHPSLMALALNPRAHRSIAKSLTVCLLSALKSHHSTGVHVIIPENSSYFFDLYTKLGFVKLDSDCLFTESKKIKILGRTF